MKKVAYQIALPLTANLIASRQPLSPWWNNGNLRGTGTNV